MNLAFRNLLQKYKYKIHYVGQFIRGCLLFKV